jgi:hypothetical protein
MVVGVSVRSFGMEGRGEGDCEFLGGESWFDELGGSFPAELGGGSLAADEGDCPGGSLTEVEAGIPAEVGVELAVGGVGVAPTTASPDDV